MDTEFEPFRFYETVKYEKNLAQLTAFFRGNFFARNGEHEANREKFEGLGSAAQAVGREWCSSDCEGEGDSASASPASRNGGIEWDL